jgi:uncharacterized protein YbaA (DUF1428 family)
MMGYIDGFVVAVPAANKEAYRALAAKAAPLFREFGALRHIEAWGDDVPKGKLNDFYSAVKAEDGEEVVFSWIEYPSRAVRDAANSKIMSDPRMEGMGDMPFDGKRMIYGGFAPFLDAGNGEAGAYVDGQLLAVPDASMDAYEAFSERVAGLLKEYGALRVVQAWAEDVPEGKVTDYRRAVMAKDGETVVYSWAEWPSRQARDAGWQKVMQDERMHADDGKMAFDGQRTIYGGFIPILDERAR